MAAKGQLTAVAWTTRVVVDISENMNMNNIKFGNILYTKRVY